MRIRGLRMTGAGDRGALFLSAGEGDAALTDGGRQARRELFEFAADVRGLGGFEHLGIAGPGSAEGDVLREWSR